nr:zinc finger, CCHC-type [Tanacetum cinerariifolium]
MLPSFFLTKRTGAPHGNTLGRIKPRSNNSCNWSFNSLNFTGAMRRIDKQVGGLYYFDGIRCILFENIKVCSNFSEDEKRLGHPSDQVLLLLKNDTNFENNKEEIPCDICQKAKQMREPFPLRFCEPEPYTAKFGKLDKFEGSDLRYWQKKMHFLLTTLKVVYVLSTPMPEFVKDETLDQTRTRCNNSFDALNDDNLVTMEVESVSKASTSGMYVEGQNSTPVVDKINRIEKHLKEEKCVLVDVDGKPLEKVDALGDYDNDDEVESVDNDMARFLASNPAGVGYGTKNLMEQ